MRKLFLIIGITAAVALTGCSALYERFGTSPEELHDLAVEKVTDYAEAAITKKIESSENLTAAGKEKLKAEVAKLKAEILARIAAIKAKLDDPGAVADPAVE